MTPPEPTSVLRARFRASELDRSISALRFRLGYVQWLYLPVLLIVLILMVVGLILGMGSPVSVLGGIAAIGASTASLFRKAGGIRDQIADLSEERDSWRAVLEPPTPTRQKPSALFVS